MRWEPARPPIPAEAWIVRDDDGSPAVDYDGEAPAPPAVVGPFLAAFARLGQLTGEDLESAVVRFVLRYGPLRVCREHEQDLLCHWPATTCPLLRPEPLALWTRHAVRVGQVLYALDRLKEGTVPQHPILVWAKSQIASSKQGHEGLSARHIMEIEQLARWARKHEPERWEEISEWSEQVVNAREERVEELDRLLRRVESEPAFQFADEADAWDWIAHEVGGQVYARVRVSVGRAPLTRSVEPELYGGLLGRVYGQLAIEATAERRGVAFCSYCGEPFAVTGRAPKRGQRRYCPSHRRNGFRQQLSAQGAAKSKGS